MREYRFFFHRQIYRQTFRKLTASAPHLSVPGLVQESSSQMQTANATTIATASAAATTADSSVKEFAENESES